LDRGRQMTEDDRADMSLCSHGADRTWRRVQGIQNLRRAGRIEDNAVEYQQIRSLREPLQCRQALSVHIATEDNTAPTIVDAICHRRSIAMVSSDGSDRQSRACQDDMRLINTRGGSWEICDVKTDRGRKVLEIGKRALGAKQQVDEATGGGERGRL